VNRNVSENTKHRYKPAAGARKRSHRGGAPSSAEFCAQLREHLSAELDKPHSDAPSGAKTNFQALSEKLVEMAVGGSKDAIHIVLDRMAGRAPQAAAGNDAEPVQIEYVIGIPRPNHEEEEDSTSGDGLPSVPPSE
jgi:hypothetical protein